MSKIRIRKQFKFENCRIKGINEYGSVLDKECRATIEIQSREKTFRTEKGDEYTVVRKEYALVVCDNITRDVNWDSFEKIDSFVAIFPVKDVTGAIKDYPVNNITPVRIDLDGDWIFKISDEAGEDLWKKHEESNY